MIPLSILDRSLVRRGQPPGEALRETVRFARHAEALGYRRFWVSEHHGVPGIAGSAPTVLAAAVAAATERIRVGTGGVMLPNHRTLLVAEQFGVLESLFPGRIDMGLGRSVGFTDGIRRALGTEKSAMDDFGAQLAELHAWFTDGPRPHSRVHARPAEGLRLPAFVLANDAGAQIAAEAGAALVIGGLRPDARLLSALDRYRSAFRPSAWWDRPQVILAGGIAVAGTPDAARRLLAPETWSLAYSRTHGVFPPLIPAEEIAPECMTRREREFYESGMRAHLYGTDTQVAAELDDLLAATAADELLLTMGAHDREALLTSCERLAELAAAG
ncbi:MsnO8 family LLM class oxidoreductase [Streptomyces orinoci]|uniref:MsnO8 family LLM class oxidoreductase n=1 Tax=Streptomyces orinoci TaxID=67339 RepID=A0ABV3JWY7_STRON|nr:MsnO8 family LLM class oxidoreductase [Streptomyces orinoci]